MSKVLVFVFDAFAYIGAWFFAYTLYKHPQRFVDNRMGWLALADEDTARVYLRWLGLILIVFLVVFPFLLFYWFAHN